MSKVRATLEEIQSQITSVQAELDQLQAKADSEGLSPEETAHYDELVTQLEGLKNDEAAAQASQRYAAIKLKDAQPTRPAPKVWATAKSENKSNPREALGLWVRHHLDSKMKLTPEEQYKVAAAGFSLTSDTVTLPTNYNSLNYKNRTVLSKGGANTGADWIYTTQSPLVTEYLTMFSPILGLLKSETTSDGNNRDYYKIDDTAMEASYFDSETAPTISETNMVSSKVTICAKDIQTGFQKVTWQELRDSAINIEQKITQADANSKARKIEKEFFQATGNGSTGVQGILAVDNSVGSASASAFDQDDLEELYYSIPPQYRANAVFAYSDDTARVLRRQLKDDVDRSLFDKNIVDGVEWDVLLGKRAIVSAYMPDDLILFFVPEHYMLRMVEGQQFQVFTERFAPHKGFLGYMSFGGAWLGPTGSTGTCQSFTLTS